MPRIEIKETVEVLRNAAHLACDDDRQLATLLVALRQMKLEPAAGSTDGWMHVPSKSVKSKKDLIGPLEKYTSGHDVFELATRLGDAREKWSEFISNISSVKRDSLNKYSSWLETFYELGQTGWSRIDDQCWGDVMHSWDDEGRKIIVVPSERKNGGLEYRIVALDPDDIVQNAYGRTESLAGNIQKFFTKPMLRLTKTHMYDDYTYSEENIQGAFLSAAAIASGLLSQRQVLDIDGKMIGLIPSAGGTGMDACSFAPSLYIEKTFPFLLQNKERQIEHISAISNNPDEPTLCYIRKDYAEGDCPTWMKWIEDTFEDPEGDGPYFMAWCGSTLDAGNTGKQACNFHGFGSQGLSKVVNALMKPFGSAATALSGSKSMTNQFGLAKLEGKRLVAICDNKNTKIMMTEWVHNLTGGDSVDIERKGKDSHAAKLVGKLLICGNCIPEINFDEQNQRNRILYIPLKRPTDADKAKLSNYMQREDGSYVMVGDSSFGQRLEDEVEAFLGVCWKYYEKLAPTRSDIVVSADKEAAMEAALTDTDTMNLQRLADEVFEFGEDYECDPSELYDAYKGEAKRFGLPEDNQYYGSRVKAFLVNNGLILTKRTTKREHGAIVHVPPRAIGVRPKSGCTADGVVK